MDSQMEALKSCIMDCAPLLETRDLYAMHKNYSNWHIVARHYLLPEKKRMKEKYFFDETSKYVSLVKNSSPEDKKNYMRIGEIVSGILLSEIIRREKGE